MVLTGALHMVVGQHDLARRTRETATALPVQNDASWPCKLEVRTPLLYIVNLLASSIATHTPITIRACLSRPWPVVVPGRTRGARRPADKEGMRPGLRGSPPIKDVKSGDTLLAKGRGRLCPETSQPTADSRRGQSSDCAGYQVRLGWFP